VLKNKSNQLQGYVYVEVVIEMAEASIEYIGTLEKFQNQDLGTMMLKGTLTEMFHTHKLRKLN